MITEGRESEIRRLKKAKSLFQIIPSTRRRIKVVKG
jgi:hypothetical protein